MTGSCIESNLICNWRFNITVHEKSILLPLLPASFLVVEEPFVFQWFIHSALLSMFPLLKRDNLVVPYAAMYGLFVLLYHAPGVRKDAGVSSSIPVILKLFASACSLVIHIVYITVTPPEKYPFLFEAVIMSLCFSQFVLILIYINLKQWAPSKISSEADTKKKRLWFSLGRCIRLQAHFELRYSKPFLLEAIY